MKRYITLFIFCSFALLHADWQDKIDINGYFNVEYEDKVAGDDVSMADEYASFDSDMLDIVLNIQATEKLRVAIDFTWEHGAQSEIAKGNVGYEYAFAEYTFSDKFKLRAGKMFTPFGIYNEIHTAKPSVMIVKEPNATNKMYFISRDKYEQIMLYPRWGTGLAILGNSEIMNIPFNYNLQIANGDTVYGSGQNEYNKDDNNKKSITARIRANVTDDLELGVSYHQDTMVFYDKVYVGETKYDVDGNALNYVSKEYIPTATMDVNTQGIQLIWYPNDSIRFEAEYMSGKLDIEGVKSFRRSGYTLLPSYSITDNINIFFLYAKADPNHNVDSNSVVNYSPGINFEFDHNVFLKLDYFTVESEKNNSLYAGKHYSELRAALAIGF